MKAYRCKVSIKNSRPPVWQRCWIPGGISFSALSIILDELTEERHGDDFRFEVFRQARAWELSEDAPLQSDYYYTAYSAAHTPIDALFDLGRPVNYLGAENTYRIDVEEQTEAYDYPYPLLVKAVSVPNARDRHERLKAYISVEDRECGPLTRRELLSAVSDGVLRLGRVSGEPEEDVTYKPSAGSLLKKLGEMLRGHFLDEEGRIYRRYGMEELLSAYGEADLRILAADYGLADPKSRDRDELIGALAKMLLEPERVRRAFGILSDDEAAVFEKALASHGHYAIPEGQEMYFDSLREMGYVFIDKDGAIADIPSELDAMYEDLNTEAFHERRRKRNWIMRCLNEIVPPYYCIMPLKKFCRLCRRTEYPRIEADEVPALLEGIPPVFSECVLRGDELCHKEAAEDTEIYDYVVYEQGDKPYRIMREAEIAELLAYGYPPQEPAYIRLKDYLTGTFRLDAKLTEEIAAEICEIAAYGNDTMKTYEELCAYVKPNRKQAEALIRILQDIHNNTPTCLNRGFAPSRLLESRSF